VFYTKSDWQHYLTLTPTGIKVVYSEGYKAKPPYGSDNVTAHALSPVGVRVLNFVAVRLLSANSHRQNSHEKFSDNRS